MKWLRTLLLIALVPACFVGGMYGGPWLRQTYAAIFPAPEYRIGDYGDLYAEAGKQVVMFSTSTCPYCKKARELLAQEGVPYRDYVVDASAEARKHFLLRGGGTVPLIYVGDREIRGFREKAIRDGIAKLAKNG